MPLGGGGANHFWGVLPCKSVVHGVCVHKKPPSVPPFQLALFRNSAQIFTAKVTFSNNFVHATA